MAILKLGPVAITFFGLITAIGFVLSSFFIWKEGKEENFNEEEIIDAVLLVALASLLTSRLVYILFFWEKTAKIGAALFDLVNYPGFSWVGAFLGGIISLLVFCQKHKWNFFKTADFSSFGIGWLAVFISMGSLADKIFLFNKQWPKRELIELLLIIGLLKILYYFDKHYRTFEWYKNKRGEAAPGFLFFTLLIGFSLIKFIAGFFAIRHLYWTLSQTLNLLIFLLSLGWLYSRSANLAKLTFLSKLKKISKHKRPKLKSRTRKAKKFHYKKGVDVK